MRDGNKESAKELLSTLRTLVATSLAITLFMTNNRKSLHEDIFHNPYNFAAVVLFVLSIVSAIYNCFLIIPKLDQEVDNIIYEKDVAITSLVSVATFLVACAIVILSPA